MDPPAGLDVVEEVGLTLLAGSALVPATIAPTLACTTAKPSFSFLTQFLT